MLKDAFLSISVSANYRGSDPRRTSSARSSLRPQLVRIPLSAGAHSFIQSFAHEFGQRWCSRGGGPTWSCAPMGTPAPPTLTWRSLRKGHPLRCKKTWPSPIQPTYNYMTIVLVKVAVRYLYLHPFSCEIKRKCVRNSLADIW